MTDVSRKRELALIHMAKAHFKATTGMNDEDYRAVLRQVTGKASSAELDARGREKLLQHFKAKGFVVKGQGKARRMSPYNEDQVTKLLAMWWALSDVKAVEVPANSEACLRAVEAWGCRQLSRHRLGPLDSLRFADSDQLNVLVESMKSWGVRVKAKVY